MFIIDCLAALPKKRFLSRTCLPLFLAILPVNMFGQLPSDGRVLSNSYVNQFLHFTYTWPKILVPVDVATLALRRDANNKNEYALFSAKKPDAPFGVIMLAERVLQEPGWRDPSDFLALVRSSWEPKGNPVELGRRRVKRPGGLLWEQLDYNIFNEYSSTLAAETGGFLIVVRCSASNRNDLDAMSESVLDIKVQK